MDNRLTPATHAHRLYREVKELRAALAEDGFSPDTIYYVVMSALARLAEEDAEREKLNVMVNKLFAEVEKPIIVPLRVVREH